MENIVKAINYDYVSRQRLIAEICENYSFVKKTVLGKSCAGRVISALKIGSAKEYSLIAAAFHGSEHITSTVLLMFIEELARAIKEDGYISGFKANKALTGRGIIFIPCVNPDGCEISVLGEKECYKLSVSLRKQCKKDYSHWNANLRGVDINHNFDVNWEELREKERNLGIFGPSPRRFGGYKPESEPETKALTELVRKANIRQVAALHSQGEVIYWNYDDKEPKRSKKMAEIMATSSGYALDVPTGIASGGGFKDWFISEYRKPGFTIELGKGENPLPPEDSEAIYKKVKEMLMLFSIM